MTGYPWLVADVGGTNARFALVEGPGRPPARIRALPTRDHAGLAEAAAAYLAGLDARPAAGCLAIAGPVADGRIRLTNAGWVPDSVDRIRAHLDLPDLEVVNDFAALALSLPHLDPRRDLRPIGAASPPAADGTAPLAVLGPGTGMGVAALVPVPGAATRWIPLPGEGGHVDVPAATDLEIELMRLLRAELGVGNAEYLLSGDGLTRIHRLLALIHGIKTAPLTPAQITQADDALRAEAVEVFCGLLGSFAGNVALTLGARGGVYLGGGILPRIADTLEASGFRRRFEGKPPVEDFLRAIPTALIVHPHPALVGAAAHLARSRDTSFLEPV
ncbi:glucokinase [Actinomadura rugatobispora]|uniref:Glucokinase n=1 Tax=Actinomadura rugatobispora TaxID=1994 RepID=A0ABW1A688_9ACTN|nr:glucokinase [Actinomadura rugatobispora]